MLLFHYISFKESKAVTIKEKTAMDISDSLRKSGGRTPCYYGSINGERQETVKDLGDKVQQKNNCFPSSRGIQQFFAI